MKEGQNLGERNGYPAGTFSWVELITSDVAAARNFYGELFGWIPHDLQMDGPDVYTIFQKDGRGAAGAYPAGPEHGEPPVWVSHVTVESADATAAKAKELGGTVNTEPFDIPETGRMCSISDPEGALFVAWEPKGFFGAEVVNEPSSFTWNELRTRNTGQAQTFYESLFGWNFEAFDMGGGQNYLTFKVGDRTNGGMMPMMPGMEGVPAHWGAYFGVENCEAATEKAAELGGNVIVPPMNVTDTGRISIVADPQGASFSLFSGAFDD